MGKWTDSEIELLRNNFPQKDNAELLDLFPDRSYDSIYKKAYKLGLVRACRIETVNRKQSARKPGAETKRKIAIAAKTRLSCKENHPRYKNIDVSSMLLEVKRGSTVKSVCEKYGINKTTYYKKLKEKNCG